MVENTCVGSSGFIKGSGAGSPDLDTIMAPRTWFKSGGNVICTIGCQAYGELGIGVSNYLSPSCSLTQEASLSTNWEKVCQGAYWGAGLKSDNSIWTWGLNCFLTLGVNASCESGINYSPVQEAWGNTCSDYANWVDVFVGAFHGGGIKNNGTLWTWGSNRFGELSIGCAETVSPCACAFGVQECTSSTNWWKAVGNFHATHALKTDGTLWGVGGGQNGVMGRNNSATCYSSPIQEITSSSNWCFIAAGGRGQNVSAIKTDGTLWGWGYNIHGEVGVGTDFSGGVAAVSSPAQEASSSTNWCFVSVGAQGGAAIKTDSTLWVWGRDCCGSNGNNVLAGDYCSPVQESQSFTNWKYVSKGFMNTGGIRDDGTLWVTGSNCNGLLGWTAYAWDTKPIPFGAGNAWKQVEYQRFCGLEKLYGMVATDDLDFTP